MSIKRIVSWRLYAVVMLAGSCADAAKPAESPSAEPAATNKPTSTESTSAGDKGVAAPASMRAAPANAAAGSAAANTAAPSSSTTAPSMPAVGVAGAAASMNTAAAAGASGAGQTPASSMPNMGSATMTPMTTGTSGPAPKLPAITGDCPKFATGDWSFSGLTGVMEAGAKTEGTAPLVFYWAGTDFPASTYTQIGDKNVKRVTSEGGVIVSIQGSAEHALDTDCSITGYYSHDFEPIGQIAACAVRDFGIDPRRIYSTGCSAGGVTSGCMATRCSSYIAAVATNSGGLTSVEELEDPSHVPAVMSMHGGAADFGGLFTTDSRNLDMAIKNAGGFAINCDHGGGHCAASAELYDAAFDFLWAHPFGVEPLPYASGLPMNFPDYCMIF